MPPPLPRSPRAILDPVIAIVRHDERARAEELLGPEVKVVTEGSALFGWRIRLLLRTYGAPPGNQWEVLVAQRCVADRKLIVADLDSLAAILGAVRQLAPWIAEGRARGDATAPNPRG